jgi:hypothetical protein
MKCVAPKRDNLIETSCGGEDHLTISQLYTVRQGD